MSLMSLIRMLLRCSLVRVRNCLVRRSGVWFPARLGVDCFTVYSVLCAIMFCVGYAFPFGCSVSVQYCYHVCPCVMLQCLFVSPLCYEPLMSLLCQDKKSTMSASNVWYVLVTDVMMLATLS